MFFWRSFSFGEGREGELEGTTLLRGLEVRCGLEGFGARCAFGGSDVVSGVGEGSLVVFWDWALSAGPHFYPRFLIYYVLFYFE